MKRIEFTREQECKLKDPTLLPGTLAKEFGCSVTPIIRWRVENGIKTDAPVRTPLGRPGISDSGGRSTIVSKTVLASAVAEAGGAESYLRGVWGLTKSGWHCTHCTGNQWEGPIAAGETAIYAQVKGTFIPLQRITDLIPKPAEWSGPVFSHGSCDIITGATTVVVLGDHQAPYYDEELHLSTLNMISAVQPDRIVHLGDLCDYTNISKYKDHSAVKAAVDECTQSGVDILVSLREAAPNCLFEILPGNHDMRPLNELLLRAERMAGIKRGMLPGESDSEELISLNSLWRLDELGIQLVEDARGWEHAEVELIPGPTGLVVIHGYLTGSNVASRTLDKVGRSVIMGHSHHPEHVYSYSRQLGVEQQAVVVGCQCTVRGHSRNFPTFAPNDTWLQGPVVVTIHEDNEFTIERARWNGENLILGQERFR